MEKKYKLMIVWDSVEEKYYWAYHTPNLIIESKKMYKKESTCKIKALNWALKKRLNWYELFLADEEIAIF